MKMTFEVTGLQSGTSEKDGNPYTWAKLSGRTTKGGRYVAMAYDSTAEAITRELVKITPQGEEVGSTRIVVVLTGEWKDGKPYTRATDGKTVTNRHFRIATFDILSGHQLELARLRRDVADKLALAEEHRLAGRMDLAYRTVAEFAAVICNKELDLSGMSAPDEEDEVVYGDPDQPAQDPEAAAAARFASMDGVAEPMAIARKEAAPAVAEAEVAPAEIEMEAEAAEPEAIADEAPESEQERDVLDDGPADPVPAAPPARQPPAAAAASEPSVRRPPPAPAPPAGRSAPPAPPARFARPAPSRTPGL